MTIKTIAAHIHALGERLKTEQTTSIENGQILQGYVKKALSSTKQHVAEVRATLNTQLEGIEEMLSVVEADLDDAITSAANERSAAINAMIEDPKREQKEAA